jgi:hypothetical protein
MKNTLKQIRIQIALALLLMPMLASFAYSSNDRILAPSKELTFLIGPFGGLFAHSGISQLYLPNDAVGGCLPAFKSESKISPVFGLKAFIPMTDFISISPRVQLEDISSDLSRNDNELPILGSDNQITYVHGEHKLDLKLKTFDIDLLATYSIVSIGLYGALGPSISFLSATDYTLSSNLVAPAGFTYMDGSTSKKSLGQMTKLTSLLISIRAGVGWNYQLTDLIFINPELLYSIPLSKIATNSESKIGGFLFTLGVLISL